MERVSSLPGKIYLIQSDKSLQALSRQPYPNDDDSQVLLEQYPDLATGDQKKLSALNQQPAMGSA